MCNQHRRAQRTPPSGSLEPRKAAEGSGTEGPRRRSRASREEVARRPSGCLGLLNIESGDVACCVSWSEGDDPEGSKKVDSRDEVRPGESAIADPASRSRSYLDVEGQVRASRRSRTHASVPGWQESAA